MIQHIYPITAVFAVILIKEGFLLIQDNDKPLPKIFKTPGGRVEPGETPLQALKRELAEECIGLSLEAMHAEELLVIEDHKKKFSVLFFYIRAEHVSIAEIKKGREVEVIKVVSKKELEMMISYGDILPKHALALTKACKKAS